MSRERTPWALMLAAAADKNIAPHRFWRLSLSEWRSLHGHPSMNGLNRAALDELLRAYPDTSHD
ncbi:MAG: phage tail assembly chaperone [Hyphomonadaceae bacterium]|nr:phage tail assembly chaperone [Hyphomonadaceae bacterium]